MVAMISTVLNGILKVPLQLGDVIVRITNTSVVITVMLKNVQVLGWENISTKLNRKLNRVSHIYPFFLNVNITCCKLFLKKKKKPDLKKEQNSGGYSKVFYIIAIQTNFAKIKSSCLEMFFKISVLKKLANFTRKHVCQSLFLIKTFRPATLLKRGSNTGVSLQEQFFYRTHLVAASVQSSQL